MGLTTPIKEVLMIRNDDMERRVFLKNVSAAAVGGAIVASIGPAMGVGAELAVPAPAPVAAVLTLPALPYGKKALDPFISEKTVSAHYDVHHKGYIDAYNKRVAHLKRTYGSLDEAIKDTVNGINLDESLNRIASLAWNHNLYWPSMKPGGGAPDPKSKIARMITESFGSYAAFAGKFKEEALKMGIGWVWVIADAGKLGVLRTDYFTSPVSLGKKAVLGMDVWEHAYYLDYQHNRDLYVDVWLKNLANWEFAEKQLPV